MEKEIELLSRVVANHLFLGQFEPFRALLLSLHRRRPEFAASILRSIISSGGRVDGLLFSPNSCPSPAHLSWLSTLLFLEIGAPCADPVILKLKAEFVLLIQTVLSNLIPLDEGTSEGSSSAAAGILNNLLELGFYRLRAEVLVSDSVSSNEIPTITPVDMEALSEVFISHGDVFDALCSNIQKQIQWLGAEESKLAITMGDEGEHAVRMGIDSEALVWMVQGVQRARLDSLRKCMNLDDVRGAASHLRFLHLGYGVDEAEYKAVLQDFINMISPQNNKYGETWHTFHTDMILLYVEVVSSGCVHLVQMLQVIQDELISEELEQHKLSDYAIPLPLQKYLNALSLKDTVMFDGENRQGMFIQPCMRDLYHLSRISRTHVLECIIDASLNAVRMGKLEEATNVLSIFPLLQPLVAALGWDLLPGKTALRRKLMRLLWTSKSQALRIEEFSLYKKQSVEMSCVEYLCDLLCYHLDLSLFVACVNSGKQWNSRCSLPFALEVDIDEVDDGCLDPFVENLVLERLSVQTPMRVLFDLVPGIKFRDAFELMNMQPIASSSTAWKRVQDIELVHMRYALESIVLAFGAMVHAGDEDKMKFYVAVSYLKELQIHLEAISNVPRKIFMVNIFTSLICMDEISMETTRHINFNGEHPDFVSSCHEGEKLTVISFTEQMLDILRHNLTEVGHESENMLDNSLTSPARQALEWRVSNAKHLIDDWEWRLSVLQRLENLSGHPWNWREALTILRAAPSKLLNLCMQKEKYDIGEEAVLRFSLPPEDKASLELAEWVAGAFKRSSVEDVVSRVAEEPHSDIQEMDFASIRSEIGSLSTILLCLDVAAVSAKSMDVCRLLLDQAREILSEIYPGSSSKATSAYWDHVQEVAVISVASRILQRLNDFVDQEKVKCLQYLIIEDMTLSSSNEPIRQGQKQRALVMLHQMIDDAHKGKRQFLSGKLHNLARALADEDAEGVYRGDGICQDKRITPNHDKGLVLGYGFKAHKSACTPSNIAENNDEISSYGIKDSSSRFFGPLTAKSTYLSSFIIYIASIGDIVDGVDTTHDFNFFSLAYEWPKDLLTRLVFERGSTEAAEKVSDIMCVDFVHEVISACVPPVLPPRSSHGWACIPVLPTFSGMVSANKILPHKNNLYGSFSSTPCGPFYPLQLDVVKHLAKVSPVRAVLASVFGSSILSTGSDSCASNYSSDSLQTPDSERLFYEFALDQSERFPTLNRWIQMQSNLHRVSETSIDTKSYSEVPVGKSELKLSAKRSREPEIDTESEVDEMTAGGLATSGLSDFSAEGHLASPKSENDGLDQTSYLSFDWENEGPYEKAVERLIDEGKLMDALALSDRCLRDGASDKLLQLLIERGEDNNPIAGQTYGNETHSFGSNSWQYCLRLKDKQLAARLALNYLHRWDLDAAVDVLTMCSCHLPQSDSVRLEVIQMRQALQRYSHILCSDDCYSCWQEVEADCKEDPEGLALRLGGKGAVSAALEVAECASLSIDLRRELQSRQLVKLLTTDPLNGGGPAAASRFLSTLRDSDDAMPVAIGAMQLLPDLRSKQLLVHFFLKRRVGNLSNAEVGRLNSWALGLRVLALLPLPSQQRCSSLHEHPQLIIEVLLMMKQLQSASLIIKDFPSLRDDNLILSYAAKAIVVSITSVAREPRISVSGTRAKQKGRSGMPSLSSLTQSIGNLHKEARRAFSWNMREAVNKPAPKDAHRKRKVSGYKASERGSWEPMGRIQEERGPFYSGEGQERSPFMSVTEEWALTGDPDKDNLVRSSHRYETSPDITLFKALLALCSDDLVSAKGAIQICVNQMNNVLSSQHLPLHASMETLSRAYHATETYVQALAHVKGLVRKLTGNIDLSSASERSKDDDASADIGSLIAGSQCTDEPSELLARSDIWLGRAELLQSLLGSGIVASLDDISDSASSALLRDRLIKDEQYSMAVYTCKKCKMDSFPVWNAWGHALIRMGRYAQARVKFKQALQLYKGEHASVILEIINTIEGDRPADISSARSMYEHLAKSAPAILDDSLSADSYLNVLYLPSTFPRSEMSIWFQEAANNRSVASGSLFDDGPCSNLDDIRYSECIHYLQEYSRQQMLMFMFRHGHYVDACSLFFPPNSVPSQSQLSSHGTSSPQRPDPLATDYGTFDDLCDLCVGYGCMGTLEGVISSRTTEAELHDMAVKQYTAAALARICNYCEIHRHFNYLYNFQVLKEDHVAASLCCIQLFINSSSQEEAIKHLGHAKTHFEEELTRDKTTEIIPLVSKSSRGKSAAHKLTTEGLVKFSARVSMQIEVVKAFNNTEGPQWKHSLFGNPNDPDTFRRRCKVAETLAEKHFDLAFQVIYEFNLPAVDIYAGVAASLAERKKGSQLSEVLKSIKGTIGEEDWDQVLGAAINVYANTHKERPDRLIDMLTSSHRKVLACVVCGRLKSAFQIASRSGSVADVQYVAHQALHANALPVLDMCKQWLAQYM